MASKAKMVNLGYVSRPNGLGGAVVLHSDPSMSDILERGLEVELIPRSGPPIRTKLTSAAPIRGGVRVTFDNVRDRNQSEALVGATVHVERDRLPPLGEDEFLDTDLIGLEVLTADGRSLGRLVEVIATGANDVYVAQSADGSEILIPAVAHAVIGVDLKAARISVNAEALEYMPPPAPPKPAKAPQPKKPAAGLSAPSASAEAAPSAPGEVVPSAPAKVAPSAPAKVAPSASAEAAPRANAEPEAE